MIKNLLSALLYIGGCLIAILTIFIKGRQYQEDKQKAKEVKENYDNLLANNKIKKDVIKEVDSLSFADKSDSLFKGRKNSNKK